MQLLFQHNKTRSIYFNIFYGSTAVISYAEVDLYDFGTIVGAVGGSLGLFLGFSCFECGRWLIDMACRTFCPK